MLYTFSASIPDSNHVFDFIRSAQRFCSIGKKKQEQPIKVFTIFIQPRTRDEISWEEVEVALDWTGLDGMPTKKTTLSDHLRKICLDMCVTFDPSTQRPFNSRFISIKTERNKGLVLRPLTHVGGRSIKEYIGKNLKGRLNSLLVKGTVTLPDTEILEASFIRNFLSDDYDIPSEITGNYKIERLIGKGATGRVYKAVDIRTGAAVALKILKSDASSDTSDKDRFLRGAEMMKKFKHPNIISILDVGEHNHRPFYVAEFIEGKTLAECISEKINLSAEKKISVLRKIIEALAIIHGEEIAHRDLKPENILLTREYEPIITDFDCAYLPHLTTISTKALAGTLYYMSPERYSHPLSRDTDHDIYAFGMIALEFLTNIRQGERSVLLSQLEEDSDYTRLKWVLMLCTSFRSAGRYKNAKELSIEWDKALTEEYLSPRQLPVWSDSLVPTNLSAADMMGHNFDYRFMPRANFRGAVLRGSSFRQCVLSSAVFMGADIRDCCFDGAFLIGARMHFSKVAGSTFRFANLERTVWDDVDLKEIDLSGANLWGAFLEKAVNLELAKLEHANFARNVISNAQKKYLKSIKNITRAESYGPFIELARARYGDTLPADLWWIELLEIPDFSLTYY